MPFQKNIIIKWLFLTAAICLAVTVLLFILKPKNKIPKKETVIKDSTAEEIIANKDLLTLNIPDDGKFTLVLDAGHGGIDDGAVGDTGRFMEKKLTLSIVKYMKPILDKAGIKTMLTRTGDDFFNPIDRTILIQQYHADLLVSIHGNFIDERWAKTLRGIEVYYDSANIYSAESKLLAKALFNSLKHIDSVPARRVMKKETGIYILRNALCPAALVEAGYLTNPAEVKQLEKKNVQQQIATALSKSIIEYASGFTQNKNLYDDEKLNNKNLWLIKYPDSIKENTLIKLNGEKITKDDLYRLNAFDITSENFSYAKNDSGKMQQVLDIAMSAGSKKFLIKKIDLALAYAYVTNKRNLDRTKLFYKFSYCKPNGETWVYIECNLYNKQNTPLNFFDKSPLYIINSSRMSSEKMKEAKNKDYQNVKACRAISETDMKNYFTGNTSKYSGAFILDKSEAAIDSFLVKKISLP